MVATIAALYVDKLGHYPKMASVDAWDAERDARNYPGPFPGIFHPPCGPYGRMAWLCTKQDPSLAPLAVEQLAKWGGVLEHPQYSKLWKLLDLPRPGELPKRVHGQTMWSIEVRQVDWGHVAVKPTWLLFCGVQPRHLPPMPPRGTPTHSCAPGSSKGYEHRRARGLKAASRQQRRRTPPRFAQWLATAVRAIGE